MTVKVRLLERQRVNKGNSQSLPAMLLTFLNLAFVTCTRDFAALISFPAACQKIT